MRIHCISSFLSCIKKIISCLVPSSHSATRNHCYFINYGITQWIPSVLSKFNKDSNHHLLFTSTQLHNTIIQCCLPIKATRSYKCLLIFSSVKLCKCVLVLGNYIIRNILTQLTYFSEIWLKNKIKINDEEIKIIVLLVLLDWSLDIIIIYFVNNLSLTFRNTVGEGSLKVMRLDRKSVV